jgi:hypothetical protein
MKKPEELQLADKKGIPHELISLIQDDPEIILAWYHEQRQNKPSLPSSITSDPERRTEKAATAAYATEEQTHKAVTINRHIIVRQSPTSAVIIPMKKVN